MAEIIQILKCEDFTDCCTHYNGTKAFKLGYWKSKKFRFAICKDCETPTLIATKFWSWVFINFGQYIFDGKIYIPNNDVDYYYQNGEFVAEWLYDKDDEKHKYFCPQCGKEMAYDTQMEMYICENCHILGTKKYNEFHFLKGVQFKDDNSEG